jgi:beta-lactamase class A
MESTRMSDRRRAFEHELDRLIAGFSGHLSLYAKDLSTSEAVERDADAVVPTASCIKVFILMELMRRAEAGDFTLQRSIPVVAQQQVGGSGVLKDLTAGIELPLRDVATLMIVLSDNTATNMLIDLLDRAAINEMIRGLGLAETKLLNRVDFAAIDNDVRRFAVSTAREFAAALEQVAEGRFVSTAACATIVDIMERQQYLDLLPRFLPYNPYARELGMPRELRIANKTGFFPGVRCDTAILLLPRRTVVVAAFTHGGKDLGFSPDNEGAVFLGRIGLAIYDYFAPE